MPAKTTTTARPTFFIPTEDGRHWINLRHVSRAYFHTDNEGRITSVDVRMHGSFATNDKVAYTGQDAVAFAEALRAFQS